MAHAPSPSQSFVALARGFKRLQVSDPLAQCLAPRITRYYATHADLSTATFHQSPTPTSTRPDKNATPASLMKTHQPVLATLYAWPSFEPTSITFYSAEHLNLPLRKDILHRAVVYEGDATRQGTASTKYRTEVHGSGRKIRPQKGTGHARLSDRKSPSIRGGGVAHGPHPRDFSTDLPAKIYDLAWRTALSYRYKKGELVVLRDRITMELDQGPRFLANLFEAHGWGKGNGRTLVVIDRVPEEKTEEGIASVSDQQQELVMRRHAFEQFGQVGEHAEVKDLMDVDCKDLLSCGRVVIEKQALQRIFKGSVRLMRKDNDPLRTIEEVEGKGV